jgi:Skp family chaperone for outer membrane proteins
MASPVRPRHRIFNPTQKRGKSKAIPLADVQAVNVLAIDTHEVVKELKAVGFSEDQAEAVTRVVRRSQDVDLSGFATKLDLETSIESLRKDIQNEIQALRKDVQGEIQALRKEMQSESQSLRKEMQSEFQTVGRETDTKIESLRRDTRADIADMRHAFDTLRQEVKATLADQKAEIIKWVFSAIGFQTVVIIGAVIALFHTLKP